MTFLLSRRALWGWLPKIGGFTCERRLIYEGRAVTPDQSKDEIFVVKLATRADATDDQLNDAADSIESIGASQ